MVPGLLRQVTPCFQASLERDAAADERATARRDGDRLDGRREQVRARRLRGHIAGRLGTVAQESDAHPHAAVAAVAVVVWVPRRLRHGPRGYLIPSPVGR